MILILKTKNDKTHQSSREEEQQERDPVFCHFYFWCSVFYVVIELMQTAIEKNIGKKVISWKQQLMNDFIFSLCSRTNQWRSIQFLFHVVSFDLHGDAQYHVKKMHSVHRSKFQHPDLACTSTSISHSSGRKGPTHGLN